MRFSLISHLITHACRHHKAPAIFQLGVQFAFQAQQDVALLAPMISQVAGAVLDHAHADAAKYLGAPVGHAGLAGMFAALNLTPVGNAEWDIADVHRVNPLVKPLSRSEE